MTLQSLVIFGVGFFGGVWFGSRLGRTLVIALAGGKLAPEADSFRVSAFPWFVIINIAFFMSAIIYLANGFPPFGSIRLAFSAFALSADFFFIAPFINLGSAPSAIRWRRVMRDLAVRILRLLHESAKWEYYYLLLVLAIASIVNDRETLDLVVIMLVCIAWKTAEIFLSIIAGAPEANMRRGPKGRFLVLFWSIAVVIILFAKVYSVLGLIRNGQSVNDFGDCLYFSVVTWTTLGYGDITPSDGPARLYVSLEALIGYFMMAIMVAALTSIVSEKKGRQSEK